jgi:hypothetical protein
VVSKIQTQITDHRPLTTVLRLFSCQTSKVKGAATHEFPNNSSVTAPKNHDVSVRLTFDVSGAGTPLPLNQVIVNERSMPFGFCPDASGFMLSRHKYTTASGREFLNPCRAFGVLIVCNQLRIIKTISKKTSSAQKAEVAIVAQVKNACQAFFECFFEKGKFARNDNSLLAPKSQTFRRG